MKKPLLALTAKNLPRVVQICHKHFSGQAHDRIRVVYCNTFGLSHTTETAAVLLFQLLVTPGGWDRMETDLGPEETIEKALVELEKEFGVVQPPVDPVQQGNIDSLYAQVRERLEMSPEFIDRVKMMLDGKESEYGATVEREFFLIHRPHGSDGLKADTFGRPTTKEDARKRAMEFFYQSRTHLKREPSAYLVEVVEKYAYADPVVVN